MDDQTVRTICYLSRLRLDDEKSKKIENEYRNQVDQRYYSSLLKAYQVEDKRAENLVKYN